MDWLHFGNAVIGLLQLVQIGAIITIAWKGGRWTQRVESRLEHLERVVCQRNGRGSG